MLYTTALYGVQEPTVQCTVLSTQQSSPSLVVLYPDLTTLNVSSQSPINNEKEHAGKYAARNRTITSIERTKEWIS